MKKFFVMAAMAAAVSVISSCSESEETVVNPQTFSVANTRLPMHSDSPDYKRAAKAAKEFYGEVIEHAYSDGAIDVLTMEQIVIDKTGISKEQLVNLEMQTDLEGHGKVLSEVIAQIKVYFKMRREVTDQDVVWVDNLCQRYSLSESDRQEVVNGVIIAKLTAESAMSLAVWNGPQTRATLDFSNANADFLQINGFRWKVFLCNVGCGAVGTIAGIGVQGVVGAAIGAGSCSGGTGAVAVVAGAVTGVVVGAVLSTAFC